MAFRACRAGLLCGSSSHLSLQQIAIVPLRASVTPPRKRCAQPALACHWKATSRLARRRWSSSADASHSRALKDGGWHGRLCSHLFVVSISKSTTGLGARRCPRRSRGGGLAELVLMAQREWLWWRSRGRAWALASLKLPQARRQLLMHGQSHLVR